MIRSVEPGWQISYKGEQGVFEQGNLGFGQQESDHVTKGPFPGPFPLDARPVLLFALAIISGLVALPRPLVAGADPLQYWEITYPARPALGQVVTGKGIYVGVPAAGAGVPWVSVDGVAWSRGSVEFDLWGAGFSGIAFADGLFTSVTPAGEVFSSRNGTNWTTLSVSPVSDDVRYRDVQIAYGNGRLVTVSHEGLVAVSYDGLNWSLPELVSGAPIRLWFGNGIFLLVTAINEDNEAVVLTSVDGFDWKSQRHSMGGRVWDVRFSDGFFTAALCTGELLISTDGTDWRGAGRVPTGNFHPEGFIYAGGRFLGRLTGENEESVVVASSDGVYWNQQVLLPSPEGFVYSSGRYVAYGQDSMVSVDGTSWVGRHVSTMALPTSVAYGNGRFVAVGGTTTLYSTNGTDWVEAAGVSGRPLPTGVYFANGLFLGPSWPSFGSNSGLVAGGTILTSTNGIDWAEHSGPPVLSSLRSIVYGNGSYAAIGEGTGLYSSPDGIEWTKRAEVQFLTKILFGNGFFLASAYTYSAREVPRRKSFMYRSLDGIVWTKLPAEYAGNLMTFGNGVFVEQIPAGFERHILSSADGVTWTTRFIGPNLGLASTSFAAYGAGTFLVLERYDALSSSDTVAWRDRSVFAPSALAGESVHPGLVFGNGVFVSVVDGLIQKSKPVLPLFSVNVVADPTTTSVLSTTRAVFRFSRTATSAIGIDLLVRFDISGTAQSGEDYFPLPPFVIIPAFQITATVPVVPIANPLNVNGRTLTINLVPQENYVLGTSNFATLQIEPLGEPTPVSAAAIARAGGGSVSLAIRSLPGTALQVDSSKDLITWAVLTNVLSPSGLLEVLDPAATEPYRFYRARPLATPAWLDPFSPVPTAGAR